MSTGSDEALVIVKKRPSAIASNSATPSSPSSKKPSSGSASKAASNAKYISICVRSLSTLRCDPFTTHPSLIALISPSVSSTATATTSSKGSQHTGKHRPTNTNNITTTNNNNNKQKPQMLLRHPNLCPVIDILKGKNGVSYLVNLQYHTTIYDEIKYCRQQSKKVMNTRIYLVSTQFFTSIYFLHLHDIFLGYLLPSSFCLDKGVSCVAQHCAMIIFNIKNSNLLIFF